MSIFEIKVKKIDGSEVSLDAFRGQVMLIVNVASQCGFTPQYAGLEMLYQKFASRGFTVLGFPCNQFGSQEPGTGAEIQTFCETKFKVTFPLFAKVQVKGKEISPLYQFLTEQRRGLLGSRSVKWNFTKFLVDARGEVTQRFGSLIKPESIEKDIEKLLSPTAAL
jgi:glutathione peroxidase